MALNDDSNVLLYDDSSPSVVGRDWAAGNEE
jgi:hypothetical protein